MTALQYIGSGVDPTTVAVVMEDGGALIGLVIAAISTALTHATGGRSRHSLTQQVGDHGTHSRNRWEMR